VKRLPIIGEQHAESCLAQPHRLFEHRVEHPGEVAGRAVDDLQDFGNGGLLRQRLVARGRAGFEFASKCRYRLAGINLCVVEHRFCLPRTIACDDTPLPPFSYQRECAKDRFRPRFELALRERLLHGAGREHRARPGTLVMR
jgi:hypothetical protein